MDGDVVMGRVQGVTGRRYRPGTPQPKAAIVRLGRGDLPADDERIDRS